jgi:ATP-dependent DNA helicase RecG
MKMRTKKETNSVIEEKNKTSGGGYICLLLFTIALMGAMGWFLQKQIDEMQQVMQSTPDRKRHGAKAHGQQIYWICKAIEDDPRVETISVKTRAKKLAQEFPQAKIEFLHGRMKPAEKDEIMTRFAEGKIDILVSTTVVEVGVDVPNATLIVIENAESYGLAQLHQLRGRVGRSSLQSYCILVSSSRSQETRERLSVMTQTNDGFVIAEKDLQIRGPGEFLGTRQSGLPDLILSDIVKDAKILEIARMEAIDFVKNYNLKDYPLLEKVTSLQMFGGLEI